MNVEVQRLGFTTPENMFGYIVTDKGVQKDMKPICLEPYCWEAITKSDIQAHYDEHNGGKRK